MDQIRLKTQDYDKAKSVIKAFANKVPENPQLKRFEEDTFFGMLSRNVTGKEMNEFVLRVQDLFIETNRTSIGIIKEFNEIYNVFNALDHQYINYFQASIKNLNLVSEEARKAGNDAIEAQKDIKRTIQALRQTIEQLSKYRVDSIDRTNLLTSKLEAFENTIAGSLGQMRRIEQLKREIELHTNSLKCLHHLNDVDDIWEDVNNQKSKILKMEVSLKDIDTLWQDVQLKKVEMLELGDKVSSIFNRQYEIDSKFSAADLSLQGQIEKYKEETHKTIRMLYVIAALALLFSIVQCIINNI